MQAVFSKMSNNHVTDTLENPSPSLTIEKIRLKPAQHLPHPSTCWRQRSLSSSLNKETLMRLHLIWLLDSLFGIHECFLAQHYSSGESHRPKPYFFTMQSSGRLGILSPSLYEKLNSNFIVS